MPPLLVVALALWAACAGAYTLLGSLPKPAAGAFGVAGAALSAACGVLLARRRRAAIWCVLLGLCLGACCAGCGAYAVRAASEPLVGNARTWTFTLAEDARSGSFGAQALAWAQDDAGARVKVSLMLGEDAGMLLAGSRLEATCALEEAPEERQAFLWGEGACATARARSPRMLEDRGPLAPVRALRMQAIGALGAYGGAQAGILQALACGYRDTVRDSGAYARYQAAGLAHLVAVSGAHLSLVVALLGWVLGALHAPRPARLALSAGVVGAYLVLAGVPLSALRAAAMVLLALVAPAAGRRASSLNALALSIMAFVALDPSASVSASLFLSAGSVLGIVLFAGLFRSWLAPLPRALQGPLAQPLALAAASNLVTQPFSAALFAQLPLVGLVANVLAAPLFTLGCVASLIAGVVSCAFPAAAPLAVGAARAACLPLEALVALLARLPYACVAVDLSLAPAVALSAAACAALWIAWPQPRLRTLAAGGGVLAAALALALVVAPSFRGDEIIMLDVGQGDAFVVRSGGASVLVDTGNQDALLRRALGRNGVYGVDALIVSHADDDHCGSMGVLEGVAHTRRVCVAAGVLTCPCVSCERLRLQAERLAGAQGVCGMEPGDALEVGRFTLKAVWPHAFADEGGNADSLCVLASLDADGDGAADWTALFCGDAESEQVERIVDEQGLRGVDVLKVGHHGARVALTEKLAAALAPRVALISCGAHNRYGHPSEEALTRLGAAGARIIRTDQTGDARLSFAKGSLRVTTERPG
ncbi:DNA internalization-related competence protein ComEC/Rec2 [Adlercreutzia sp. ZJ242]|uniref:DNA internalization-related competence protein ComEC/Rec2 n=1 Tax=Adlercreutzia sp. ZJ242 TaxID=2709409 RepID=UPI00197E2B4F|nr:DNA internalization-related competence protein ComEC/Rec2 [Adlercreutzia sp. ZJ242]